MAARDTCSSCFRETGYTCLICSFPFCNKCSVFEQNEDTPGWNMVATVNIAMKKSKIRRVRQQQSGPPVTKENQWKQTRGLKGMQARVDWYFKGISWFISRQRNKIGVVEKWTFRWNSSTLRLIYQKHCCISSNYYSHYSSIAHKFKACLWY